MSSLFTNKYPSFTFTFTDNYRKPAPPLPGYRLEFLLKTFMLGYKQEYSLLTYSTWIQTRTLTSHLLDKKSTPHLPGYRQKYAHPPTDKITHTTPTWILTRILANTYLDTDKVSHSSPIWIQTVLYSLNP
jgi:hypothetical protein